MDDPIERKDIPKRKNQKLCEGPLVSVQNDLHR